MTSRGCRHILSKTLLAVIERESELEQQLLAIELDPTGALLNTIPVEQARGQGDEAGFSALKAIVKHVLPDVKREEHSMYCQM